MRKLRILICYVCGKITARAGISFTSATLNGITYPIETICCSNAMVEYDIDAEPIIQPLFQAVKIEDDKQNSTDDSDKIREVSER